MKLENRKQFILASRSPRRKALLRKICRKFVVVGAPEPKRMPNLRSREITKITLRHAKAKAGFVSSRHPHAIVIAADTLLSCQGKVLGKPSRLAQAREMLMHIHGRRVVAATSICVYSLHQKRCWTEQATIRFKIITPGLLRRYLASNAWRGKAGGFNVKEKPVSGWIVQIKGDLNTVVGLPLKQLKPILRGLP